MKQSNHIDLLFDIEPISSEWLSKARNRLDNLVKPKGSLGLLEDIAAKVVAIRKQERPFLKKRAVFVFAGDHGVVTEGISAYPQDVTLGMVKNFLNGVAAINAIAKGVGADVYVVDIGVNGDIKEESPFLIRKKVKKGTQNIVQGPAMTLEEAKKAINVGIELADMAKDMGIEIIATGDMGIGNTTSSAALFCALLGCSPEDIVGKGTGIDDESLMRKIEVVKKALMTNKAFFNNPINTLSAIGGLEIAGICGLCIGGAKNHLVVLVDGFIASAAALVAIKINQNVKDYMFFSHVSAEKGHRIFFEKIGERPILNLDMRLGEGTGAVLAMHIIDAALMVYNEMATFEEVGIAPGPNK